MENSINVDHIRFQSLSQVEAFEILKEFNALKERIKVLESQIDEYEGIE